MDHLDTATVEVEEEQGITNNDLWAAYDAGRADEAGTLGGKDVSITRASGVDEQGFALYSIVSLFDGPLNTPIGQTHDFILALK